ncbi:hypothetical protein [Asticcacaulis benevestitus]|uniref:Uncharacterized protein n=1 Tax=Asticcacaulis benevestitus DSM 16100 = ATCC BAA-896 TaxID=1121022 RepID=V4Q6J8_9CAUL|nr:hypothetical protein [Asticcacaulis benevestitus]ESQ93465.1 hypothetical protein ABENE_06050 [Asticcacaulis benevestitus DSM 16100 = ATCC BAA-896]
MNAHVSFTEPDDDLARDVFASLSHIVSLTTLSPFDIDSAVSRMGLAISRLQQYRLSGVYQHRFRVSGLTPGEARRMTDRLAHLPGVAGAQVEHLISRV